MKSPQCPHPHNRPPTFRSDPAPVRCSRPTADSDSPLLPMDKLSLSPVSARYPQARTNDKSSSPRRFCLPSRPTRSGRCIMPDIRTVCNPRDIPMVDKTQRLRAETAGEGAHVWRNVSDERRRGGGGGEDISTRRCRDQSDEMCTEAATLQPKERVGAEGFPRP